MQTPKITIVLVLLIFAGTACRKSKNNSPSAPSPANFTGCRISQITDIQSDTSQKNIYAFTYNNDGTVASITNKSVPVTSDVAVKKIKYNAGSIVVSLTDGNYPYSKDSVTLDAQNRVVRIDHWGDNEAALPNEVYEEYQYDNMGNMITLTSHSYSTISTTVLQWKNGDVVWQTAGNNYYSYFFSSIPYNTGNIKALIKDFENYGCGIYTPEHVSNIAIMDEADTVQYDYTFDTGGRITQLTVTEDAYTEENELVSYQCE